MKNNNAKEDNNIDRLLLLDSNRTETVATLVRGCLITAHSKNVYCMQYKEGRSTRSYVGFLYALKAPETRRQYPKG